MAAIRTSCGEHIRALQLLCRWPGSPSMEWCKGFLAGIFDAEGSYSHVLRVSNTDRSILGWTVFCMARLGFAEAVEKRNLPNGLEVIRLRGGLREALRFFHTTGPAITRKWDLQDVALKSDAKLQVVDIRPLNLDLPMY